MKYRCLNQQNFGEENYQIVPIRREDMGLIKQWRNEQIDILRQSRELSDEDQSKYWKVVIAPGFQEQNPKQLLFSFLHKGKCIGYGGLTHIDWDAKRGEVSFLLETRRTKDEKSYQIEFLVFLELLKRAAFGDLNFHRIFAETFNVRSVHLATLEHFGFKYEGTLKDHVRVRGEYCDSLIHGLIKNE
jgi:RimJ/RimL family protein N-acetyltransferase